MPPQRGFLPLANIIVVPTTFDGAWHAIDDCVLNGLKPTKRAGVEKDEGRVLLDFLFALRLDTVSVLLRRVTNNYDDVMKTRQNRKIVTTFQQNVLLPKKCMLLVLGAKKSSDFSTYHTDGR